jgi:hypothetical protein
MAYIIRTQRWIKPVDPTQPTGFKYFVKIDGAGLVQWTGNKGMARAWEWKTDAKKFIRDNGLSGAVIQIPSAKDMEGMPPDEQDWARDMSESMDDTPTDPEK